MPELQRAATGDVRTRVEDYLNDKIQTAADLDQVDALVQRVQEQQGQLRKQLQDARKDLLEAQERVAKRSSDLRTRAEAYQTRQADLEERIQDLIHSDVSDEAVQKFEARMNKVRSLEIARGFLQLVQRLDTLNEQATKSLVQQPAESVTAYIGVRGLRKHIQDAQTAAEGAAPQLAYLFEETSKKLYATLKKSLEASLETTMQQMKWPEKKLNLSSQVRQNWEDQVRLLLDLQDPDLVDAFANVDLRNRSAAPDPVVLLPLEVMSRPLAKRFQWHFYGTRPTNRRDKPEYFLTHVLDLLDQHNGFMNDMLDPILDERARNSEALESIYTDAVSAFITALLPMVEAKCLSFLPEVSQEPQLFSHFVHELMAFDTALRETWGYVPIPRMVVEWRGLTWRVLNTHGYFETWLRVEKDFALSRYSSIRDAPDSNDIDFDADSRQTKPTKGAIRVNDLLETITDRYRGLSSFSQKMKFLLEIQLSIFDDYHSHLHGALQAYLVSSHTAGRLLQGQTEADAFGLKGLEALTKVFGSAEFLERKMSDWSDDVFFVELWDELQDRAKANSSVSASVGTGLRIEEVAEKTSATIRANGTDDDADADGSGLFDQTASAYQRLRERGEEEMLRFLDVNLRAALRPYTKSTLWSSLAGSPSDVSAMPPSSSLDGFFQTTSTLVGYLARALAPGSLRRIIKHYCNAAQREIFDTVLMQHSFSATGAAQLARDLSEIKASIEKQTQLRTATAGGFQQLEEALYLLTLDASTKTAEDDGWGFDDVDKAGAGAITEDEAKDLGLWEVERLMFESNESARKALGEMGLFHLNEAEARNVLKRRVEWNDL
ncbi:hypothetical protein H2200_000284 [Cladophialophora chaetospira]|uniref:RINT-1 family protein n=1 Tax=Cladophialophora chaetospira TaxID=386627 RepID=A0AA38XN47_9EURO|nr:hypothetical protein H2200_000284 [Cladophialophora chaetospira]